jgi:CubicO group peptidase (beta-lactamase class C family)
MRPARVGAPIAAPLAVIVVACAPPSTPSSAPSAADTPPAAEVVVAPRTEAPSAVPAGPVAPVEPVAPPRDESARLRTIIAKHRVPALVTCRIDGTRVTRIGAAGVRRRGEPELVTTTDRMHLGSCTKAMTATLCALLVREGKLSWTTTIGDVFPERREAMGGHWRDVRLESLLHNRSGAPATLDEDGLWRRLWAFSGTPRDARLALLDGVLRRKPEAAQGAKYVYSNAGFSIAGAMAERVTGESWESLTRERVFAPLGMRGAGFGAPGAPGAADEPRGHFHGEAVEPGPRADNPPAIAPAGTVHAPIEEWARFAAFHALRGRGFGEPFESLDWRALHDASPGGDYAMGWAVTTRLWAKGSEARHTGRVLSHSGSNTMWFCVLWVAPEREFAIMACCNEGGDAAAAACDEAVAGLTK